MEKASTISKLLRYKINKSQRIALYMLEHINGCGGKGGTSFDNILDFIEGLEYFDPIKFRKFKRDLKKLCEEHDIDFARGGLFLSFWRANRILVDNIDQLTYWVKDDNKKYVLLGLKIALNTIGMKYFTWSLRRKTFISLFTNYKHIGKK